MSTINRLLEQLTRKAGKNNTIQHVKSFISFLLYNFGQVNNFITFISFNMKLDTNVFSIVDLFSENEFLRVISYQKPSLRCEMQKEIHFDQKISMIVCLLRIW